MNNPAGQPPQLQVDISAATDVSCDECDRKIFRVACIVKKLSALISPTGKEMVVPVQVLECSSCGNVNDEFLPQLPIE